MAEYIGLFAAFCTTTSFLPQAIKVLQTKDTESISLLMYIIFSMGVCAWLAYGILTANLPIILANVFTLILSVTILSLKIREVYLAYRASK